MVYMIELWMVVLGACAGLAGLWFLLFVACFKRCPSNKILAVYGRVGKGQSVNCYHGGGAFVWPLVQDYAFLDLIPMTINIPLRSALSLQNIRINVPSTFTVAVSIDPEVVNNAAVRLLNLNHKEIELMAVEIIIGQLRLTIASLTIEQINQDREKFFTLIKHHIVPELHKIGLELINVNVTDIHDESGYIESIGKKAASTAVNQAKIDVAEQQRRGEIGKAHAEKEQRIQVAAYQAQAVEGENKAKSGMAQFNADLAEQEAIAQQRSEIAQQKAFMEIQRAKALAEQQRLEAEQIVPQEIKKRQIEIEADAAAEKQRREGRGRAEAILAVQQAESVGIQKILAAKAEGYKHLLNSCDNNAKDLATLLLVEKLEELVKLQTEAIKNIKIDKITVWDGGGEKGGTTANFMSSMVKSLPPLHDVASMAGIDLPEFLGKVTPAVKMQDEPHVMGAVKDKTSKAQKAE